LSGLKEYEARIKRIVEKNEWSQTPNVTLLESARKVLNSTDRWRRDHPKQEVVREILEAVFFLLATSAKLNHNIDLDEMFTEVCKSKDRHIFSGVPNDLVWSFILYSTEPHHDFIRESLQLRSGK